MYLLNNKNCDRNNNKSKSILRLTVHHDSNRQRTNQRVEKNENQQRGSQCGVAQLLFNQKTFFLETRRFCSKWY